MQAQLSPDTADTALFIQHYPLTTTDNWWSDFGASGTTVSEKKDRLLGLMSEFDNVALLAGHRHSALTQTHQFGGRTFSEHIAPYFGGANLDDPTLGGGFLALLISPTEGILEVRTIPGTACVPAHVPQERTGSSRSAAEPRRSRTSSGASRTSMSNRIAAITIIDASQSRLSALSSSMVAESETLCGSAPNQRQRCASSSGWACTAIVARCSGNSARMPAATNDAASSAGS